MQGMAALGIYMPSANLGDKAAIRLNILNLYYLPKADI